MRATRTVGVFRTGIGNTVYHLPIPFLRYRTANALAKYPVNLEQGINRKVIHLQTVQHGETDAVIEYRFHLRHQCPADGKFELVEFALQHW